MQPTNDEIFKFLDSKIRYHQSKVAYYETQKQALLTIIEEVTTGESTHLDCRYEIRGTNGVSSGKYANDSMKTAIVKILEEYSNKGVPALTTKEIYAALTEGGYPFKNPENHKKQMGALSTFLSRAKSAGIIRRDDEERVHLVDNEFGSGVDKK